MLSVESRGSIVVPRRNKRKREQLRATRFKLDDHDDVSDLYLEKIRSQFHRRKDNGEI